MPRRRDKTRVELLADAHTLLIKARSVLDQVDLRTTTGALREAIREARNAVEDGLDEVEEAITLDVPKLARRDS